MMLHQLLSRLKDSSFFLFIMNKNVALHNVRFFILMVLLIQSTFLQKTINCQFHWGKNYRLEAKQLREIFARARAQKDLTTNQRVSMHRVVEIFNQIVRILKYQKKR